MRSFGFLWVSNTLITQISVLLCFRFAYCIIFSGNCNNDAVGGANSLQIVQKIYNGKPLYPSRYNLTYSPTFHTQTGAVDYTLQTTHMVTIISLWLPHSVILFKQCVDGIIIPAIE